MDLRFASLSAKRVDIKFLGIKFNQVALYFYIHVYKSLNSQIRLVKKHIIWTNHIFTVFYKSQIDFRFPRIERFKITYFSGLIKCDSFRFFLWWFLYTVRAPFRVCRTAQRVVYCCLLIYLFVGQFLIVDLAIIWIWHHLKLTKLRIQFKSII